MPKIIAIEGPGSPDEDRRDDLECGGWAAGRRTYEHLFRVWPNMPRPNPFADVLDRVEKFLASRTLSEPLPWENSRLLKGDAAGAVARSGRRVRLPDPPGRARPGPSSFPHRGTKDQAQPRRLGAQQIGCHRRHLSSSTLSYAPVCRNLDANGSTRRTNVVRTLIARRDGFMYSRIASNFPCAI